MLNLTLPFEPLWPFVRICAAKNKKSLVGPVSYTQTRQGLFLIWSRTNGSLLAIYLQISNWCKDKIKTIQEWPDNIYHITMQVKKNPR